MRDHEGLIAASLQFQTCSKFAENLVFTRFSATFEQDKDIIAT